MEKHSATSILSSVCRLGGQKCNETVKYNAGMFANTLQSFFQIDREQDGPNVHPKYICEKCERLLYRLEHGGEYVGGGCRFIVQWEPHARINCKLRKVNEDKSKGGRP